MATFLFDSIVFGPVRSRRLGVSLGINLLPLNRKVCSFNCIYCECGWTSCSDSAPGTMPSRSEVYTALRDKLAEMKRRGEKPDVITYAGNGEPTLHRDFPSIISDSVDLRNTFFPEAKISVLTNASTLARSEIRDALLKADMSILKLDSAFPSTVMKINQPNSIYNSGDLEKYTPCFKGRFIIQTLFLRGNHNGQVIDNTTEEEVDAWVGMVSRLRPESVMIYTIDRDTPLGNDLKKVSVAELNSIARKVKNLGIAVSVSG